MAQAGKTKASKSIKEITFIGLGDLIKLLPTGTVFMFQFLNPLLTNNGSCNVLNKYLGVVLVVFCSFCCCFSCFTDSYIGRDGKVCYGIVTPKGMWSFSEADSSSVDLTVYKLRLGDCAHSLLCLLVFAVIVVSDDDTISCFCPALETQQQTLLMVLPTLVGGLSSSVFMMFPNDRHGIGYPVENIL